MSKFQVHRCKGIKFLFKFDEVAPDLLHIYARHLTTARDAIETYFEGQSTWNEQYERFETSTATHCLYWFWLKEGKDVMVISCFRN
jgi:ribosomal protein L31